MKVSLISPYQTESEVQELPIFQEGNKFFLKPFDLKILSFLDALSKSILSNREINKLPEIAALGFWLRKSNLLKMKEENKHLFENKLYKISPRGTVFHVCPANVDTMFLYSLAVSLLVGNKNILRVSKRMNAPHLSSLFQLLNESIEENPEYKSYINIVSYEHDDEISNFISTKAAARVIWGGDRTIETFKQFKTSPRTKDIVFSDRISILCIGSKAYNGLNPEEEKSFAKKFYNDAYTFDQKGCSSPQSIFIIGDDQANKICIEKINANLSDYAANNYKTDAASLASLKLNYIVDEAMQGEKFTTVGNNLATFLIKDNQKTILDHTCGGGIFYLYSYKNCMQLEDIITPKLQTIAYFGLTEKDKEDLLGLSNGIGIDRIVPLGSALAFYYIWDGYNLFDELSKKVYVE